jgi:hypothetical protein
MGRNRVVRRLFEALGYDVRKLDRFYYAGLTKKELARGAFRDLTQREIVMLKHFTGHPNPTNAPMPLEDEELPGQEFEDDNIADDFGDDGDLK